MSTARKLPTPVVLPVSGVSYRQGVVRTLREGQRVVLHRERDNEFDENAVAIHTLDGDHFGYVPRDIAGRLIGGDETSERWGGEIVEMLTTHDTWGVRVRVTHSNVRDFPIKGKSDYIRPVPVDTDAVDLPEDTEGPVVVSKSGRILGQAVDYDAESPTVKVSSLEDGGIRLFPAAVVLLK